MSAKKNISNRIFWGIIVLVLISLIVSGYMTFCRPIKAPVEVTLTLGKARNVTVRDLVERPWEFRKGDLVIVCGSTQAIDMKQELVFTDMNPRDARQYIVHEFSGYTNFKTPIFLGSGKNLTSESGLFRVLLCEVQENASGNLYLLEKEEIRLCWMPQTQWKDNTKCTD